MNNKQTETENEADLAAELRCWIDVDDRLPELNTNVLVMLLSGLTVASRFDDGEGWLWAVANYIGGDLRSAETLCDDEYLPTHWMPLPKVPDCY